MSKIDEILDKLQAKDFYDAVQAIEKLGASEDFTASVTSVGELGSKHGNYIITREEAKAQLRSLVDEVINDAEYKTDKRIASGELSLQTDVTSAFARNARRRADELFGKEARNAR